MIQNHDLHIHGMKSGNPSHPKERMTFAEVWEHSAEEKDRNYDQDVTEGLGEVQDQKIAPSAIFIIRYYDRLKGYVTRRLGVEEITNDKQCKLEKVKEEDH
jgi:hypothetical protein